ncbi:hypothetical protein NST17_20205 [Caldifermentibacillus hisashii]|uniref:Uncharacterized protein n=1 Tax=Caldifermentibacillus hisashii TaxID=996558 RepID=A0ABU9K4T2_9BACI
MNIFEVATRKKFRFPFKGLVSVEDLWDLSVQNLDLVFKTLNSELKKTQEESLLNTKAKEDKELEQKVEIVKHIVNVKLEEENMRLKAKEQKEQKQKIMEILLAKQDETLYNKSVDELKAMLAELEG